MKIVGVVKSIVGTDAVIAIDEDGNQRAIFPGDTLYDNEKLLELSGVQVNIEPVTVADSHKKSEAKSDKEVASLQDALLNGKDISELEETAAGGDAGGGNASSDGVSLGAASFVASGHESSIHADASAYSQVAPASVAGVTNVSGGADEFTSSLETLTVANELLNPQPTPVVSETPVAITPATPGEVVTPSTPSVNENPAPAVSEQPANPSQPANPGTWEEPIVVDPSDPHYDHNHHFDDEPTTPVQPTPSTQPSEPTPSEPSTNAHVSDSIFEITRMYTDEIQDLRGLNGIVYADPEDNFDRKPTFEGKATPFADIKFTINTLDYDPDTNDYYAHTLRETITTKANANGDWKIETLKEYGLDGGDYHRGEIKAEVTNPDGHTFTSDATNFYMALIPIRVAPEDHL